MEQTSEPESDMAEILELSDQEFRITMISIAGSSGKKWETCKNRWVM